MEESTERTENRRSRSKKEDGWLSGMIIYILAFLLAIPFAIVAYDFISFGLRSLNVEVLTDPKLSFGIGLVIGYLLAVYMLRSLKPLVFILLTIGVAALSINQFRANGYSFENLYHDYNSMLYAMWDHREGITGIDFDITYEKTDQIKQVVDFESPEVRTYSVQAASKYFNEDDLYYKYGDLVRYFSVFKTINESWIYVRDPKGEEYFASTQESMQLMAGDCDDHTVLMVSCIKAVGGRARMVHVKGHIFPEVNVGPLVDFDRNVAYLVSTLFKDTYDGLQLRGHVDENGEVWLNFDYTSRYPGGPFINDEIIRIEEI